MNRKKLIIYIYLYGLLKRRMLKGSLINITEIYPIIKQTIRINGQYKNWIVEDLIDLGLLKRLSRDIFEIMPIKEEAPIDSLNNPLW